AVFGFIALGLVGLVSGVIPFAYGVAKCGGLPVESSNFAASFSYNLPGDKAYGIQPLSYYEFCTATQAENEGYHRDPLSDY
ncbi:MAG: hypothetical protein Q7T74_00695, partial [Candidatus Saccharibacteria bacterium]|nr:hypothetical protein [Candidatus Saccharibacteria bacterium]